MTTATTAPTYPQLRTPDVTVHADKLGREVITIPDAVARALHAEISRGWHEIPGVADGYSRPFAIDSWVAQKTETIMAAYAASDVPAAIAADNTRRREHYPSPAERARADRERVARYGGLYAFIVGESGWDADASWWRDYNATRDLHTIGNPARVTRGGRPVIEFSG